MQRFLFLLGVPVLLVLSCKKSNDCSLNDPAPSLYWEHALEAALQEKVLQPFVYGADAFFPTGLNHTALLRIHGKDGAVSYEDNWAGPSGVERYFQDGADFYWGINGNFFHSRMGQNTTDLIGTVGSGFVYNEGWCTPFEGLVAGIFREKSMNDRDDLVAVFDMAARKQLFRYEIQNDQLATFLGDPVLGRTAGGDTVLAFVENTKNQLLIFNLSEGDTTAVDLSAEESYLHGIRNIHILDGRILLGLRSTAYGIDAATGAILWQREEGDPSGPICRLLPAGGQLLFHANTQKLYALDPATGEAVWENGEAAFAALDYAVRDGVLYYTTWDPSPSSQRLLMGIDLEGGCKRVQLRPQFSMYAGLTGITSDGYLILGDALGFAAYK